MVAGTQIVCPASETTTVILNPSSETTTVILNLSKMPYRGLLQRGWTYVKCGMVYLVKRLKTK